MNYDSYLAHAIEIFNDKMDADFSGDDIILTCFMTDDQEGNFRAVLLSSISLTG